MNVSKLGRRRGTLLEDEVLSAAWTELLNNGYANFTMDAVAARAKTSRPVLYRRWPHRVDLAMAAMRHHNQKNPLSIPDTGNIRDDLVELLWTMADRGVHLAVSWTLQMTGIYAETGITPTQLREDVLSGVQNSVNTILLRGIARGEIDGGKLTPRIMSLPNDLLRNEVMMTLKPVPRSVVAEMVDEIFLPLVAAKGSSKEKRSTAKVTGALSD